ncbi:peptidase family M49-domain-containing protein [Apodospora peruviana]|uniref:Peptidase family M49-domain-containing protein n=1 Tax=Apodospora peruviana TaxID=516989 RepID=A0AAE0IQ95_9PEZI|nr:peptidase family M49-domain-containing protein [Apodospora peruviana]
MARAAWFGARIVLEQVSPESPIIFDFMLELYRTCAGDWESLVDSDISIEELRHFSTYAATFLSNVGNYFGSGDQKFVPAVSAEFLRSLATKSPKLSELFVDLSPAIGSIPPYGLGYSSEITQRAYYLGPGITEHDVQMVSKVLDRNALCPENTRIRKAENGNDFEVLLASVDRSDLNESFPLPDGNGVVKLTRGDHSVDLERVCAELSEAVKYAGNDRQKNFLHAYIQSFQTGSWTPAFEGLVAIANDRETELLAKLVDNSARFIRRLPWNTLENDGKGPIHTLTYCSSLLFPGISLPNYNDIRQEEGFKNVIIANRMAFHAYYWWVVLHELLGHGTGRMMVETEEGKYNFDIENLRINSITEQPIASCYKPGQTWTGQFGDLSTTVDECRAELVGAYLMDDVELLQLSGFTETSDIRAVDLTYNVYQQLGVDGLRGLSNFNVDTGKWGQAHSQAHCAILKCLLLDGGGCVSVSHDKAQQTLTIRVDRAKVSTHGKPALGRMLLQLHMFRCTADGEGCRAYSRELSKVEGEYVEWRQTALATKPPPLIFAQANTFLEAETVVLKEGVIQSWAERGV